MQLANIFCYWICNLIIHSEFGQRFGWIIFVEQSIFGCKQFHGFFQYLGWHFRIEGLKGILKYLPSMDTVIDGKEGRSYQSYFAVGSFQFDWLKMLRTVELINSNNIYMNYFYYLFEKLSWWFYKVRKNRLWDWIFKIYFYIIKNKFCLI